MELAKIRVTGVRAVPVRLDPIPAGVVGATVSFEYADPVWEGLSRTVIFWGTVTKDVIDAGDVVTIPAEVVADPGPVLRIGVYGVDADNVLVIPTLWTDLGRVRTAANPSGDETTDPSLPVWAQLESRVAKLEENGTGGGLNIDSDGAGNVVIG